LALLGGVDAVLAQTDPPVDPRSAEAEVRAKQEGEKIYKWIKLQTEPPKRPAEAKPAQAAAPKPAAPAKAVAAERKLPAPVVAAAAASAPANDKSAAAKAEGKADPVAETPRTEAAGAASAAAAAVATAPAATTPEDDSPLVLVHQVEPDYSPALKRRLQKGWVQVRFEVQPDGSVVQPEIQSSSHVKLNAAALQAVAQWKFQPVRRTQYGIVELNFDIE
jgi:TonB family protein